MDNLLSSRKLGLGAQRRNSSWRHQPSKAAVIGSVGGGGGGEDKLSGQEVGWREKALGSASICDSHRPWWKVPSGQQAQALPLRLSAHAGTVISHPG